MHVSGTGWRFFWTPSPGFGQITGRPSKTWPRNRPDRPYILFIIGSGSPNRRRRLRDRQLLAPVSVESRMLHYDPSSLAIERAVPDSTAPIVCLTCGDTMNHFRTISKLGLRQ